VFWQGVKGQPELDKWYEGTIVSISTLANGQLRHAVKYDGWGDLEHVHDLVNGGKPWMRLDEDGWTFATVGGVTTASTAIESTSLLIPVGGDEFREPLPAPTVPPSTPTTEQWVTVGQKRKPAVKAADAPEQLTRRSTRVTFAPSALPAKTQARTTRHSGGAVSVAELTSSALGRTQATPGMAQIIVEHLMGDEAPAFIKGDTVETAYANRDCLALKVGPSGGGDFRLQLSLSPGRYRLDGKIAYQRGALHLSEPDRRGKIGGVFERQPPDHVGY
jgi:hypothetical protein